MKAELGAELWVRGCWDTSLAEWCAACRVVLGLLRAGKARTGIVRGWVETQRN